MTSGAGFLHAHDGPRVCPDDLSDVIRGHASSGTPGKPTVVGDTTREIETWAELRARALAAGVGRDAN